MQVYTTTFIASTISGLTLIACLVAILSIYNDVKAIWNELDMEISIFKVNFHLKYLFFYARTASITASDSVEPTSLEKFYPGSQRNEPNQ